MASFVKRGKSWTYIVSRMVNGKSNPIRKGGFRTKKEAQVAAAEVEDKLSKGILPHLKERPFNDYFKNWIDLYKVNIRENTRERYLTTYNTVDDYFGSKPIQEIKRNEYQAFLNEYGKTRSKATVSKLNTHIRACVQDAIENQILTIDFTRKIVISGLPPKRGSEKHLDFEESIQLLNAAKIKVEDGLSFLIIVLGLTSGMRFGEMVGLTRKDFDFKRNTITVNKTWGYTKKMHKGFGPTKNESSNRTIKMDGETMQLFEEYFEHTADNIHRLVFFSHHSRYHVMSNASVNKALKGMLTDLGIDEISVHGLRHTHASALIYERKATINYISERLGHSDVQTTYNDYSHVMKELRAEDEDSTVNMFASMYKTS